MHATLRVFCLPKAGNSPSDYEDASWPRRSLELGSFPIRLAIGDGATEASFSAFWARLLVRDYGRGRLTPDSLPSRLPSLGSRWRRRVESGPLPWYAEAKLNDGAFASLLGLTIHGRHPDHDQERHWEAMAVGDSCLFQIRGRELIARFPLDRSELFDNRPTLVSSLPSRNASLDDALGVVGGRWEAGDVFYLMTDALACWFLKGWERRKDRLSQLDGIENENGFRSLVEEQRSAAMDDGGRILKNDDVTLVRCSLMNLEEVDGHDGLAHTTGLQRGRPEPADVLLGPRA
jgi:hypothetical protein